MKHFITCLIYLFCIASAYAQRRVVIPLIDSETGHSVMAERGYTSQLLDAYGIPQISFKPYVYTKEKDAEEKVYVECRIPKHGKYTLILRVAGYQYLEHAFEIKKSDKRKTIELEAVSLLRSSVEKGDIELGETVVKAPKLKFYFDKDTLIYNADGFLRQPGSQLSNLLQKMPGLEIKPDGEIWTNGKRVDILLLNGKDFFNSDRITLLANLPAYAVKQVKIYESQKKQTQQRKHTFERERMRTGQIMDIILKPDFQSANFANLDLGYGSGQRDYTKIFGLRYGSHYRLSGYAMSNNINRNEQLQLDGTAQEINNNPIGETRHHKIGANYNYDDYKGRFSLRGATQLLWSDWDATTRQTAQRFLPTEQLHSTLGTGKKLRTFSFTTQHEFNPLSNTPYSLILKPTLSYTQREEKEQLAYSTQHTDLQMFSPQWLDSIWNEPYSQLFRTYGINRQFTQRKGDEQELASQVTLYKPLIKIDEDQQLSFSTSWNWYHHRNHDYTHRWQDYVQAPESNLWQNQYINEHALRHNVEAGLNYALSLARKGELSTAYNFSYTNYDTNHSLFALDALNAWKRSSSPTLGLLPSQREMLSTIDQNNSYAYVERQHKHEVELSYNLSLPTKTGTETNLKIAFPFTIEQKRLDFSQNNRNTRTERTYYLPQFDLELNQRKGHAGAFRYMMLAYHFKQASPILYNLVDIENTSNPLYVLRGNPNLRHQKMHTLSGQYFLVKGMNYHSISFTGLLRADAVAQSVAHDPATGRIISTPRNVDGNFTIDFNLKNRLFINPQATTSIENDLSLNLNHSVDYLGLSHQAIDHKSKVLSKGIKEQLTYSMGLWQQRLRLSLSAFAHYLHASSNRTDFQHLSTCDYGAKIVLNTELPFNISLSTDLNTVHRRGYNYEKMNHSEWMWNARLTKAFNEQLQLQIEFSDILAQRKNVYHMFNAQMRMEEIYNGLRRYAMLHLIWRVGKQEKNNHHHLH